MKKLFLILFVFACTQLSFAAFPPPSLPATDNTAVMSSVPKDFKHLTKDQKREVMEQFSKLSVADYEKMTGKKLNGIERLSFKITQQRMKHQLKHRSATDDMTAGFNIAGFLLGFFLFLIGVLIAYLVSKDSELRKWAWIGAAVSLVLGLVLAII